MIRNSFPNKIQTVYIIFLCSKEMDYAFYPARQRKRLSAHSYHSYIFCIFFLCFIFFIVLSSSVILPHKKICHFFA
ncbi:hypothetical protein A7D23_04090 [Dehalobacter sp. TeCB1]|uniref:Uncharacterized protein n=1 Tax=Dehalobacter restrictus (strain DSM 9455 / PER-K23) TaxID=871738 RepID=A0ABN4C112_DEHRP|nr:hypothetical protein DEHRE_05415 [Dehalobacter restrictus DSM 9455]OCZ54930.1 hypothetical protein A7D23_04090 [Dehalobacter sp. TeCB1]